MKSWNFSRRLAARLLICLGLLTALVAPAFADALPGGQERLLNSVKYLAADDLEGRGVGTKGLDLAAEYVREQFAQAGLDVTRVDGGAFQTFTIVTGSKLGEPNSLQIVGPEGRATDLNLGTDYQPGSFGGSGKFDGELVFCGYGIDAPKESYSDFDGIDLKGKVAVIMRKNPRQGNPHSPFGSPHGVSRHADLRSKISNATSHGAAAILFVNDPYTVRQKKEERKQQLAKLTDKVAIAAEEFLAVPFEQTDKAAAARKKLEEAVANLKEVRQKAEQAHDDELMSFGYGGNGDAAMIPAMQITQEVCNRLLKESLHTSLEELEAAIDQDLKPRSAVLTGWKATGATSIERVRSEVKNVIGVLEGEGPLAEETIVVGAHYDHVGLGGAGSLMPGSKAVHNGADDNASGTSALIELARRLKARHEKLPRRVVFMAFTGEEMGLLGSAHYVKHPVFPLEKTVAMFNMDMVGRLKDDKLTIFGAGTAKGWEEWIGRLGKRQGFHVSLKPEGFGPSDHSSFYGKQIPVLHFFTGNHGDYHRPSDDWEKLNVAGMSRVVDLLEEIVVATAADPERPRYLKVESKASISRSGNRPYFGSIPDFGSEEPGYSLSGVAPGSPADKAGLKAGDRILQLGANKITGLDDFDLALRKFSAGDDVDVMVIRDGQQKVFKVTLDAPK